MNPPNLKKGKKVKKWRGTLIEIILKLLKILKMKDKKPADRLLTFFKISIDSNTKINK